MREVVHLEVPRGRHSDGFVGANALAGGRSGGGLLIDNLSLSLDRFVFDRRDRDGGAVRAATMSHHRTTGFAGFAGFARHLQNPERPAARLPGRDQAVIAAPIRGADIILGKGWPVIATGAPLLVFGFDDRDLPSGDFTQSRDDFLVVRLDQRPGALEQLFGPACRSEYQFEPIRNVFEAIFYSYTSHRMMIFRLSAGIVNEGTV